MKIFTKKTDFNLPSRSESLGFVATMGALHQGHATLIEQSVKENDQTCVSIFVNPTQFNNQNDFDTYPDRKDEDLKFCRDLGVDSVFIPDQDEIYSSDESILFKEEVLTENYEGAHREGHFNGVLLVVMKLLNIISPDRAYFGKKDYQQYLLIKKMSEQFFMRTEIKGVSIKRDEYGLALSSRNLNLSAQGLTRAREVAATFLKSRSKNEFLETLSGNVELEYYGEDWGRALMAHYIEGVRLIDNKKLEGNTL